jgi:hypothetical protein
MHLFVKFTFEIHKTMGQLINLQDHMHEATNVREIQFLFHVPRIGIVAPGNEVGRSSNLHIPTTG